MKIGLCLSGGGVKGAAHIGVIKALEEENIRIDCISGTSSGSIVAGMYAMGYKSYEIIELFKKYAKEITKVNSKLIFELILGLLIRKKICVEGLNDGKKISEIINKKADIKKIRKLSDIEMPLFIPSVNLYDGSIYLFSSLRNVRKYSDETNIITNIDIGRAVQASCSYPGIFCPTNIGKKKLVDGGIRENLPWKILRDIGIDKIISVVFEEEKTSKSKLNILDCITGSMGIMMHELYNYEIEGVEYILKINTKDVWLLEIEKIEELYSLGYNTAKREIDKIKKYLNK